MIRIVAMIAPLALILGYLYLPWDGLAAKWPQLLLTALVIAFWSAKAIWEYEP
jgi:hypothetical protein